MAVSTVITHGNRSLIASGTFITFDEGESRLELTVEDDRVEIIFNVINDGSDIRNNIIGQVELPDKFRVVIQNYRQVMGNPMIGPVALGQIAGRPFYLLFTVRGTKNDGSKIITYSVYVEEEV